MRDCYFNHGTSEKSAQRKRRIAKNIASDE